MPSSNHAHGQSKLLKLSDRTYADRFEAISELRIVIEGKKKIPDLLSCKDFNFRSGHDEAKVAEVPPGVIEILSPRQILANLVAKSYPY